MLVADTPIRTRASNLLADGGNVIEEILLTSFAFLETLIKGFESADETADEVPPCVFKDGTRANLGASQLSEDIDAIKVNIENGFVGDLFNSEGEREVVGISGRTDRFRTVGTTGRIFGHSAFFVVTSMNKRLMAIIKTSFILTQNELRIALRIYERRHFPAEDEL